MRELVDRWGGMPWCSSVGLVTYPVLVLVVYVKHGPESYRKRVGSECGGFPVEVRAVKEYMGVDV